MAKITYDLVSMAGILRDYVSPKYLNREHQLLVDIADSLYNTGINPKEFKAEYRDLYDQYGKSFWDKVLADMSAIDGQIYDNRGASDLFADYQDRIGDADFYEDYYDPYKGPSDGYGVYSYRNGQEDSYTYAENYDEALKYAKWDLTHKNYIDVVRIIDNATGEIVDEFDSLDSIGEGCSPRRKSKKKKIVTQGCSSKEGCGSKREIAKESIDTDIKSFDISDRDSVSNWIRSWEIYLQETCSDEAKQKFSKDVTDLIQQYESVIDEFSILDEVSSALNLVGNYTKTMATSKANRSEINETLKVAKQYTDELLTLVTDYGSN